MRRNATRRRIAACLLAGVAACGGGFDTGEAGARLSPIAALGERIFHDPTLSASGQLACASCHAPASAHGHHIPLAAPFGGPELRQQGRRAVPSLRYLADAGPFRFDAQGRPQGGFFRDGRASSLAEQAGHPFLNPVEMALADTREVAARLARTPYADEFRRRFGADVFDRPDEVFDHVREALARYQLEDRAFRPYTSLYDAALRGVATLSPQQARGLALFEDPAKGNCAACHPSRTDEKGRPPPFTDFRYHALGVPRNDEIAANADPDHHDLGLCARDGGDLAARTDLCGAFKVPTLRNVALRPVLFHNGRFRDLREALAFYTQRDIHPERFYPARPDGGVNAFDDLPEPLRANVNRADAPYDRGPGEAPALSEAEIDDVIAFLLTLTDADLR